MPLNSYNIDLFSRQIGAIGSEAMTKLLELNVLVIGASATGQECVKCLSLAGVKTLHIYDKTKYTKQSTADLYFRGGTPTLGENNVKFANELNPNCNSIVVNNISIEYMLQNNIGCLIVTNIFDTIHRSRIFKLEKECMKNNIKFILGVVIGLESYIFSNFGKHTIQDKDGEPYECVYVEDYDKTDKAIVLNIEKMNKNLISPKGALIAKGNKCSVDVVKSTLTSVTVLYSETIFDFLEKNNNIRYSEEKEVISKNYKPIDEMSDTDYQYISLETSFPDEKADLAFNTIRNTVTNKYTDGVYYNCIQHERLLYANDCLFLLCSIVGGIIAHEAIKCTGKYTPLDQEIYIDFRGLQGNDLYKSRTGIHKSLLDKELIRTLKRQKIFMVGAGALGCEISKNLGMMGICTSVNSKLNITDMDTIELSNLNRQFLFRNDTIGKLKSETIENKLKEFIPEMNIKSMNMEVGTGTEEIFNSVFWKGKDIIINALDNVAARRYVDSKCVEHDKPLFESGTMGSKCNTQTIIPYKTATYSEIIDVEDKAIPMCTIKSFPNKMEHCVEWGLETFHNTITQTLIDLNQLLDEPVKLYEELDKVQNSYVVKQRLSILSEYCMLYHSPTVLQCVSLADFIYSQHFKNPILDILNTFPEDMVDDLGKKYWSGKKLKPNRISFKDVDKSFTLCLYQLYKKSFQIEDWDDRKYDEYISTYLEKMYTCNTINVDEQEDKFTIDEGVDTVEGLIKEFRDGYKPTSTVVNHIQIQNVEYDKDSPELLAVMSSYANSRATIYNIPVAECIDIKLLSGRIIPALSTTTTVISGFVVVEVLKYLYAKQGHILKPADININLAMNQYIMFNSQKPSITYNNMFSPIYGMNIRTVPDRFTTWDKLKFSYRDESCPDIKDMVSVINDTYNIEINTLSTGNNIIYNKRKITNITIYELYKKLNIAMCENIHINIGAFDSNGLPLLSPPLILSI